MKVMILMMRLDGTPKEKNFERVKALNTDDPRYVIVSQLKEDGSLKRTYIPQDCIKLIEES